MITELISVLNNDGYAVTEVIPDGQMHRFNMDAKDKKKSGFYTAYQNHSPKSGQTFYVVVYGSWRGDDTKTYCSIQGKMTREDKTVVNAKIEEAKRKAEKERARIQEEASQEVTKVFEKLSTDGESPYLKRKLVEDCKVLNLKFHNNSIVIPVRDIEGKIWSAQTIFADGKKQFFPNGKISGNFHTVGDLEKSEIIYITEGLATAATINLATFQPVVVAFNAKNLIPVSQIIREYYPDKQIVICADDDRDAKKSNGEPCNVGKESAEEAAKKTNASVALPVFANPEKSETDFNDLHFKEGLDKVRSQLRGVSLKKKMAVYPLGYNNGIYFLTSTSNGQIEQSGSLSETDLLKLMPLEYWEMIFPLPNGKPDWIAAKSKLMDQCRQKGIFEYKLVRGSGVWLDEGRVVVNMGDHLVVDGKRCGIRDIRSKFFYALGPSIDPLPKPLSVDECEPILNAAHLFKWKSDDHGFLLAGAMVIMRVCGALPIRPHVWLTGERATGKSTLFNRFISPLMGRQAVLAMGNSTEAGIRQRVNSDAFPVVFDEFETNGKRSDEAIQSLIDLMRVAWSETNAVIYKGSATGNATQYQARFSALVVSIRQAALSDADASRFATIELMPHKADNSHWPDLDANLQLIDEDLGNRLFSRTIKLMPVLLENFKILKKHINKSAAGQRFADQYGMLLAGYSILLQNEVMDDSQAEMMVSHVKLENERVEASEVDQEACLNHLLTSKIRYSTIETTVRDAISLLGADPTNAYADTLKSVGLKVDPILGILIVEKSNSEQEKIWSGKAGKWSGNAWKTLMRLDGAKEIRPRDGKSRTRCISIPLKHIQNG